METGLFNTDELKEVHKILRKQEVAVTNPEQIQKLMSQFSRIALGSLDQPIVITGPCHEPVTPFSSEAGDDAVMRRKLTLASNLSGALHIQRDRGQNTKPRSVRTELDHHGKSVLTFRGDAVNGRSFNERTPTTVRLFAAALQAVRIEHLLSDEFSEHVPAAHEFLNPAFEAPFIGQDTVSGRPFISSTDLPWIGVRNMMPDSSNFQLLAQTINPVGLKIGPTTTTKQIQLAAKVLNPDDTPGRIAWMFRFGLNNFNQARDALSTIRAVDSHPLLMFDIHGSTSIDILGNKIRCVDDINEEIVALSGLCRRAGMKLHGIHLETTTNFRHIECIDHCGEIPFDEGNIDPQLNPAQMLRVFRVAEGAL